MPETSSRVIRITDTELWLAEALPELRERGLRAEADAIEEWVTFHGLDPTDIVLNEQPVVRDPERYQIRYPTLDPVDREVFITAVDQGEGSPLPWPDVLDAHRVAGG